jgi:hypothetical protein
LVKDGDTYGQFGGVSGTTHPVRRANFTVHVEPVGGGAAIVTGSASTAAGPIIGANVSLRLL